MTALLIAITRVLGSWVCHQLPDRSLWIAGAPLPVCARCTGIYAGALLSLVAQGKWRRSWLLVAVALVALDVSSEALGLRPAWAPLRVLVGAMLGFTAMPAVRESVRA